jgi:hypothetical protein
MATVRPLVTVSCSGSFRHTDPDLYSLQKLESGPLFRFISHSRAEPGVDVKKEYPVVQCMSSNMTLRIKFEGLHDNLVLSTIITCSHKFHTKSDMAAHCNLRYIVRSVDSSNSDNVMEYLR